jgi:hypothetical protein
VMWDYWSSPEVWKAKENMFRKGVSPKGTHLIVTAYENIDINSTGGGGGKCKRQKRPCKTFIQAHRLSGRYLRHCSKFGYL